MARRRSRTDDRARDTSTRGIQPSDWAPAAPRRNARVIVEVYDVEGLLRSQRMFAVEWAARLWVQGAIDRFNGVMQDKGREVELGNGVVLRRWGDVPFDDVMSTKLTREQESYVMPDEQYNVIETSCLPPASHPFKASAQSAQLENMPATERPLGGNASRKTKRAPLAEGTVTIKDVCAELKVEPRVARAALRKKYPQRGDDKRWAWSPADPELDAVRTLLRSL